MPRYRTQPFLLTGFILAPMTRGLAPLPLLPHLNLHLRQRLIPLHTPRRYKGAASARLHLASLLVLAQAAAGHLVMVLTACKTRWALSSM